MTRRHWGTALAAGLLIALTACAGGSTDPDDLEGTWVLTAFGEDGPVKGDVEVTLSLRDGRVGGNGGVSDLTGGYTVGDEGGALSFDDVDTAPKAGAQELMDQEGRLVETLRDVASFEVEDGDDGAELLLSDASEAVLLTFVAKP